MLSIRDRLLSIETEFLSAVISGASALESFSESWNHVLEDVAIATEASTLDEDMIALVHTVSSNIEAYASSFEDFFTAADEIQTTMDAELDSVFNQMTLAIDNDGEDAVSTPVTRSLAQTPQTSHTVPQSIRSVSPNNSTTPSLVPDLWSEDSDEDEDEDEDLKFPTGFKRLRETDEISVCSSKRRKRTLCPSGSTIAPLPQKSCCHDDVQIYGEVPRRMRPLPTRVSAAPSSGSSLSSQTHMGGADGVDAHGAALAGDDVPPLNAVNPLLEKGQWSIDTSSVIRPDGPYPDNVAVASGHCTLCSTDRNIDMSCCRPQSAHSVIQRRKRRQSVPSTARSGVKWPTARGASAPANFEAARLWLAEEDSSSGEVIPDDLHARRRMKALPSRKPTISPPVHPNPLGPSCSGKRKISDLQDERFTKRSRGPRIGPRRQVASNPLPLGRNALEDQLFDIDDWVSTFAIADVATFDLPDSSVPLEFDYTGWSRRTAGEDVTLSFASDPLFDDLIEQIQSPIEDASAQEVIDIAGLFAVVGEVTPAAGTTAGSHTLDDVDNAVQPPALLTKEEADFTSITPAEPLPAPVLPPDVTTQDDGHASGLPTLHVEIVEHAPEVEVNRSRSPSPLEAPPPSFLDATATSYLLLEPPAYTPFDENPSTHHLLPPPYDYSSKGMSGFAHITTVDADVLVDVPYVKHGFSGSFFHTQVLQAGHAIAV